MSNPPDSQLSHAKAIPSQAASRKVIVPCNLADSCFFPFTYQTSHGPRNKDLISAFRLITAVGPADKSK